MTVDPWWDFETEVLWVDESLEHSPDWLNRVMEVIYYLFNGMISDHTFQIVFEAPQVLPLLIFSASIPVRLPPWMDHPMIRMKP